MQGLLRSIKAKEARRCGLPRLSYPENLPIVGRREEIIETLRNNRAVVITGETGSGKTTQIPKMCLEAGRGIEGMIGLTQPRRIAAMTVSRRIAEEMGEPLGRSVGYKIRFDDRTSRDSYIKIMTDGILLMEMQGDPLLSAYDTLIVDEAHERSINIDVILGHLIRLMNRRRDLSVIITSATIEPERFASAFGSAPIIEVSGRTYPVEVRYEPLEIGNDEGDGGYIDAAVASVEKVAREGGPGDILIFMPTEQDIRDTCDILAGRKLRNTNVLPLFGRLSPADQQKVFTPMKGRKIIVATNVAETSITIPG
ncbi:MAG: DEAD/DEAH box helicase, partial [Deltaproteobacteria bacterium]|nr:DEAD/DEAH box helicase [Deltaproteobacteria bacterium]